jgi:hypothetical protein
MKRRVNRYFYGISILVVFLMTTYYFWSELWGDHPLGNNLSLLEGDSVEDRIIVYSDRRFLGVCQGGAVAVIPLYERQMDSSGHYAEYVEAAISNKKWVIVKTLRMKEKKENYWIISKDFDIEDLDWSKVNCDSILQSHVAGPFNLIEFKNRIKILGIDLDFK